LKQEKEINKTLTGKNEIFNTKVGEFSRNFVGYVVPSHDLFRKVFPSSVARNVLQKVSKYLLVRTKLDQQCHPDQPVYAPGKYTGHRRRTSYQEDTG
jgi:hypothetical protein